MKPGVIYRLKWKTVESVINSSISIPAQVMIIDIKDTLTLIPDGDTENIISLTPSGNPLVIKVINNDRDKFSPIRAKQAIIQFESDRSAYQDVTTFSDSSDNRWRVSITADGNSVFEGFLMLPDSSMPFQPDPNLVQLTASDHLGVLKDLPLVTDDGSNPVGKLRIAELIALCLKQTGLSLNIIVINNLRAGSGKISPPEVIFGTFSSIPQLRVTHIYGGFFYVGQIIIVTGTASNNTTFHVKSISDDGSTTYVTVLETISSGESSITAVLTDSLSNYHFYDGVYLDVKTFESEIGKSEFCYSVLEKILGEDCFLSQWKGSWYIMRVDEYDGNPIYPATFNSNGVFQSFAAHTNFNKSIGATEIRRFAKADQLLEFDRPNKFIEEKFQYEFWKELICNIDFSRGDFISDLPDETIDSQNYQVKKYSLDCWTLARYQQNGQNTLVSGGSCYVKRYYQFGYEKFREAVAEPFNETAPDAYIRSEAIPLGNGDRGNISVDFLFTPTFTSNSIDAFGLILFGKSGAIYKWENIGNWFTVNNGTANFTSALFTFSDPSLKNQFNNVNIDFTSTPEAGDLYVYLQGGFYSGGTGYTALFKNLQFTYKPLVNGSYLVYTGETESVKRIDNGFIAKRERNVFVRDSIRELFKGALLFISTNRSLFSGSISFAAPNSINYSGYHAQDYYRGQKIILTGTNAGIFTVLSSIYHIIGAITEIIVKESITTVTESATISEYVFALTDRWYSAAPFYSADPPTSNGSPPSPDYLHPYSYIQAYSVWNQYKNANRIFSGAVLGLGSMWCDVFDKISLTDADTNTNNRYFMLISFEQNWKTALWSGVFIEDYSTVIPKDYSSPHEFKYSSK
jgi:hypothetical protein